MSSGNNTSPYVFGTERIVRETERRGGVSQAMGYAKYEEADRFEGTKLRDVMGEADYATYVRAHNTLDTFAAAGRGTVDAVDWYCVEVLKTHPAMIIPEWFDVPHMRGRLYKQRDTMIQQGIPFNEENDAAFVAILKDQDPDTICLHDAA